jgi:hypothetical protein
MNKLTYYIGSLSLAGFILLACLPRLNAQVVLEQSLSFDSDQFELIERDEGSFSIEVPGADFFFKSDPELPAIPIKALKIAVPKGAELIDFQYNFDREVLKKGVKLAANPYYWPVSLPTDLSRDDASGFIHKGNFPDKVLEYTSTQTGRDQSFFCFTISPFIYEADTKTLSLIRKVDLKLEYSLKQQHSARKQATAGEKLDYLIVTTEELKDSFKPLLEWKIRKGLVAEILTLDEIYARYDEPTEQLNIKRCLSDLYESRELTWVLLGGDHDIVPVQYCYGKVNIPEEVEDNEIPADLFYACFDYSFDWNGTADARIGEPHMDFVDIVPEIYISRIPVRNTSQVKTFVRKTLNYELDPPRKDFLEKMLLSGVKSWNIWDNKSDSHHRNEQMYRQYVASNWFGKRYGFYDTGGSFPEGEHYQVSASNLSQLLNENYAFFHFAGHGNRNSYLMETGTAFSIEDASELKHEGMGIMLSTTCDVNAFDSHKPCLSESFLLNPMGGCLAFFGSSSLGFGLPNTEVNLGPSFQFNARFLELLFTRVSSGESNSFASIAAEAKASLSGNYTGSGAYWFLQYALNPMGDPELPIFTMNPKEFENVKIYRWANRLTVNTGGVEDCRICLSGASTEKGYLEKAAGVSFFTFSDVPENFQLTITKPNYIPYQYKNGISTAVNEDLSSAITIYPNPVSEILQVGLDFQEGNFTLYDMNGRPVHEGRLLHGNNQISMQKHPPGTYVFEVQHASGVARFKVLKQ